MGKKKDKKMRKVELRDLELFRDELIKSETAAASNDDELKEESTKEKKKKKLGVGSDSVVETESNSLRTLKAVAASAAGSDKTNDKKYVRDPRLDAFENSVANAIRSMFPAMVGKVG